MKRDAKGRFQSKGFVIPIPNALFIINTLLILLFLLPWLFVGAKFKVFEKVYDALSLLFGQQCNCFQNENGNTPKY